MRGISSRALTSARFRRDRSGAAAVEFALVAPVFIALVFMIMETGYYLFATSTIDAAGAKAARLIRTGQAQQTNMTKEEFYSEVCNVTTKIGQCDATLTVDVQRFDDFASLAADTSDIVCADETDTKINQIPYNTGAVSEVVRVRVCYLHKVLNPGLGIRMAKNDQGKLRLVSSTIHLNEPYEEEDDA